MCRLGSVGVRDEEHDDDGLDGDLGLGDFIVSFATLLCGALERPLSLVRLALVPGTTTV